MFKIYNLIARKKTTFKSQLKYSNCACHNDY